MLATLGARDEDPREEERSDRHSPPQLGTSSLHASRSATALGQVPGHYSKPVAGCVKMVVS